MNPGIIYNKFNNSESLESEQARQKEKKCGELEVGEEEDVIRTGVIRMLYIGL